MLDLDRVTEVAQEVARETFGAKWVRDVSAKPVSEWTVEDALEVLVVLDQSAVRQPRIGEKAMAMLNGLGDRLYHMGEDRFAHVGHAAAEELDAHDDPEP